MKTFTKKCSKKGLLRDSGGRNSLAKSVKDFFEVVYYCSSGGAALLKFDSITIIFEEV